MSDVLAVVAILTACAVAVFGLGALLGAVLQRTPLRRDDVADSDDDRWPD